MTDATLNDDQARTILIEALNRGLYESLNNEVPQDSEQRMKDAEDLVKAAKTAFNNGNRSDNVQTILFISNVDQKPLNGLNIEERKVAENVAKDNTVMLYKRETESNNFHNGIDLATLSDGVIAGLIVGLDKYPSSEQVEEDRKAYLAEKERRENEKADENQDGSQGTTAQENGEKAGEAAPEVSGAEAQMGSQESPEDQGTKRATAIGSSDDGTADSAQGEDAGAFARAQTPETSPEEKQTKAKAPKEDGNRAELEDKLSLPIIKAHGVDITKLGSIPVAQIEYMLENPEGPAPEKEETEQMSITDREVEESAVAKDVKAVGGISAEIVAPVQGISKADLGLGEAQEEELSGGISADREKLESLVTGPMLKAYGRGRKEIPSIGDNELRFMLLNPDGKITQEELEQARSKDQEPDLPSTQGMVVTKGVPGPEKVDHFISQDKKTKFLEEKNDNLTKILSRNEEKDKETVIKGPPIEEANNKWDIKPVVAGENFGNERAMEIIARENFPIPPAYSDEQAPEFPMDVSKCSREDLFSFHAQFHAYETRINYILIEYEDKLNDWSHKRSYREAVVAKSIPFMGEDGKRNTNEYRDVQVKGDEEVLELSEREHEAKKIVNDLRSLQKNYHLSCERLSRQMSKYENEMRDAPR